MKNKHFVLKFAASSELLILFLISFAITAEMSHGKNITKSEKVP